MRLLLLNVMGTTSFENLRTVAGTEYATFKEAAIALNLLAGDSTWIITMADAAVFQMPHALRDLFACICLYGLPISALPLLERFLPYMVEDYVKH